MGNTITPSETEITQGQIGKICDLLTAGLRKSRLLSDPVQEVIENQGDSLVEELVVRVGADGWREGEQSEPKRSGASEAEPSGGVLLAGSVAARNATQVSAPRGPARRNPRGALGLPNQRALGSFDPRNPVGSAGRP